MLRVLDFLKESVSDELLFSKEFIEKVKEVLVKLNGKLQSNADGK
jgi:hypothetical protein